MIKNIIFDIGGVVVVKGKFNIFMKAIAKLVFGTASQEFFIEDNINKNIKESWNKLRLGRLTTKQFFNEQRKKYHLKISTNKLIYLLYHAQKPNLRVISLIKNLKKNYKIYSITNHTKEWFNFQAKKYNYSDLFLGIATSFDAHSAKPDQAVYKLLIKKYSLNPKECLFIDDQKENLVAAKKLGMKTIHFKSYYDLKDRLRKSGIL